MLKIFLIRHGETDYNLQGIVQGGGVDSDLNSRGILQGQRFYEHYSGIEFNSVVASGMKRTYQTLQPFRKEYEILRYPEFNEMNWGIMEGRKPDTEMHNQFLEINRRWESGELNRSIESGESPLECWNRLNAGLNKVCNLYSEGNVLICAHGRVIRIILSQLLGYGMEHMNRFPHGNTALNVLCLSPSGKYYAEVLNDQKHLN